MHDRTTVYIVSYHSERNRVLKGSSGQFRIVEEAIAAGEWPYDNGDDPSFYVARRGGPLTWGVCRQDVRNNLSPGDIVVFFSSTSISESKVLYRLSAVATVASRTNHLAIHDNPRFRRYPYINVMVRVIGGAWHHAEDDRPVGQRHSDWLWRMADACGMKKQQFERTHSDAYAAAQFPKDAISRGTVKVANNYVVFSADEDETFISPSPIIAAIAQKNKRERWCDARLKHLTVDESGRHGARQYLRAASATGYFHRHIRFEMDSDAARKWRAELISQVQRAGRHDRPLALEYGRERAASCAR